MTLGALKALVETAHRVRDDMSIVGSDDVECATVSTPALNTVHAPRTEIGRMVVRKLIKHANQPQPFTYVAHVSTRFIKRENVRALA